MKEGRDSAMKNSLIFDYILALTNLYGMVPKDKVVKIYNLQNEDKIEEDDLDTVADDELVANHVEPYGDYYVHEAILVFGKVDSQLAQSRGKPFYIPVKDELLRYKSGHYFEVNNEFKALLRYTTSNFFDGDVKEAEEFCTEIRDMCHAQSSMGQLMDEFNRWDLVFDSEKQVNEVAQLVVDVMNSTRLWENNGHTPNELMSQEKPFLKSLPSKSYRGGKKIGRNEPCPCGSGKKYKKCCLN